MTTLYDFININKTEYNQLNPVRKQKIKLFAKKLKAAGLEEKILAFEQGKYQYTIYDKSQEGPIHETNLPEDLQKEIDKVWIHVNE
jgi:hypothetical protein